MAKAITIPVNAVKQKSSAGLGLVPLVALVVGSMIGGGVFSLPQNMAKGASPGAVIIGWLIAGIGMLALAFVYQGLSTRKPALDAGPYSYARAGFGDFIGFNSAWGYWLSAWIGNVSYAVLIFGALSYFVPVFGSEGQYLAGHCRRFHLPLACPCPYPHGHPASGTRQCGHDDRKAGADLHIHRNGVGCFQPSHVQFRHLGSRRARPSAM